MDILIDSVNLNQILHIATEDAAEQINISINSTNGKISFLSANWYKIENIIIQLIVTLVESLNFTNISANFLCHHRSQFSIKL